MISFSLLRFLHTKHTATMYIPTNNAMKDNTLRSVIAKVYHFLSSSICTGDPTRACWLGLKCSGHPGPLFVCQTVSSHSKVIFLDVCKLSIVLCWNLSNSTDGVSVRLAHFTYNMITNIFRTVYTLASSTSEIMIWFTLRNVLCSKRHNTETYKYKWPRRPLLSVPKQ